jgi:hypothetical protein
LKRNICLAANATKRDTSKFAGAALGPGCIVTKITARPFMTPAKNATVAMDHSLMGFIQKT